MSKKQRLSGSKPWLISFLSSLVAILLGLLLGVILLFAFDASNALTGLKNLLTAGFSSPARFAKVLYQAAPLMMTGLSVGVAFKCNLFNIGASGQYTVGAMCALIFGIVFKAPWWVCLLAAMLAGAIWGAFPGVFKAFFNVNEVITAIMFNWIGLFFVNVVLSNIPSVLASAYGASVANRTADLNAANVSAIIPRMGLNTLLNSNYMNISFFIGIIIAVILHVVLNRTTFGYELKACGLNRNASIYAGINAKRNIVLSMIIAGGLAGIGGGIYYLAGTSQYVIEKTLLSMGFDGIPVALLASSSPLGTILSSLFISYIQVGGEAMQPEFATEYIDVILAAIIYFSAFSLLVKTLISKAISGKEHTHSADTAAAEPLPGNGGAGVLPADNGEKEDDLK